MSDDFEIIISYPDYEYVDYYKEARDSFLSRKFSTYPNLEIESFTIDFTIGGTSKNAPVLYSVLESLPEKYHDIEMSAVAVHIYSEKELLEWIEKVLEIIAIVKSWKSTVVMVNDVEIGTKTEFGYFMDYLLCKNNLNRGYRRYTVDEIKKKYNSRKRPRKQIKEKEPLVHISRNDVGAAMNSAIKKYVDIYAHNMAVDYHSVSEHDTVIVIEDSLVVDFHLLPWYWTREEDEHFRDWDHPYLMIQELTHNDLFKFNFADFRRRFEMESIGIDFYPFHGLHYYREEIDNFDVVNKSLPKLNLLKRYEEYPGETHHFVILKIEDVKGKTVYGIGDTKGKVHSFILKLCKELEEKNSRTLELNGASCLQFNMNQKFVQAFLSWKGEKKRWRLENKFSYFYEDRQIKNDLDVYGVEDEILKSAYKGGYKDAEFGTYSKPLNRWKSEELVYNITRKLYKDYQVIYQYKPFFLTTDKGNMSYDIYICGLKVAIEYQGKQHFEPVDYFGGGENFKKQQERDKLKAKKSKENGVKLIYVNYWEDITPELIKKKVTDALS